VRPAALDACSKPKKTSSISARDTNQVWSHAALDLLFIEKLLVCGHPRMDNVPPTFAR
jgi:hypothetical protein